MTPPERATNPNPSSPPTRGLRAFFTRIRTFLTRKQSSRVEKTFQQTTKQTPFSPQLAPEPASAPAPAARAPQETQRGGPGRGGAAEAAPRAPALEEAAARAKRIEELRLIEEEARIEREQIEEKVAAQAPPEKGIDEFPGERRGFNYNTWFKAFGTFGELRDMGDSPTLLGDMEELDDMDVPAAFYSSGILGKVKWKGRQDGEALIEELNTVAPWNGTDFRDIYPKWEYVYKITESVGDVVVQEFTYRATRPFTPEAKKNGYKSR